MENASKALVIAGSILIGMIVISIFYFSFGQAGHLVGETDEDTLQEEIKAFNNGFEAYNKKLMYGIDVISVLNKAIDNNKKYDVNGSEKDYFVDIEIVMYDPKTINGNDKKVIPQKLSPYVLSQKEGANEIYKICLDNANNDKPSTDRNNYDNLSPEEQKEWDNYDARHDFKVSAFKCKEIEYVTKKEAKNLGTIR